MARLDREQSGVMSDDGDRVRARRERLGMHVNELAEEAGISRDTLSAIEKGKGFRRSSLTKVEKVLDAYEAEAGLDTPPVAAEAEDLMEFRVEGNFGVSVVVRGPVRDAEQLEESVARLISRMNDRDTPKG